MSKAKCSKITYLDNNSTTLQCDASKKVHMQWLECYNPNSDSKIAKPAKQLIEKSCDAILHHCGVSDATHVCIFNSGASEGNCYIIRACVKAYKKKLAERSSHLKPHVILSAVEHSCSMECVKDLLEEGEIDVSYAPVSIYGNVLPEDLEAIIKPNTCLISIMAANNEIPIINNITELSTIAHKYRIPFHSDCVQLFGKIRINVNKHGIDCLTASAHKFYGPKGCGIMVLSKSLIEGYQLTAQINGHNNFGYLRAGTENVPGIAATLTALQWCFKDREKKNEKLLLLRNTLLEKLSDYFNFAEYESYVYSDANGIKTTNTTNTTKTSTKEEVVEGGKQKMKNNITDHNKLDHNKTDHKTSVKQKNTMTTSKELDEEEQIEGAPNKKKKYVKNPDIELVSLGPPSNAKSFILMNTILLAVCKNRGKSFCNVKLKQYLDTKNVIVSIGSACLTHSPKASYVLDAISAPPVIKRGVIRISFSDSTTMKELDNFVSAFREGIDKQLKEDHNMKI